MKITKIIAILAVLVLALGVFAGCNTGNGNGTGTGNGDGEGDGGNEVTLNTHAEYLAAEVGAEVTVETYVQNKQGWWEKDGVGVASFYTQDKNGGGYFLYEMPVSADDYATLVAGTKIRVNGYIGEYAGLREIVDATFEVIAGDTYVAEALQLNANVTAADLNKYQGVYAAFDSVTVVGKGDNNAPFFYGWDGSGSQGGDIYFDAMVGETKVTFVLESYLTGADTAVYQAAEALQVGDVLDLSGYVYWYNGIQPHIVSIEKVDLDTHADYLAAEVGAEVTVEAYVQNKQGWWEKDGVGVASIYTQDKNNGGYFLYNMAISEADYQTLTQGTKIRITGYVAEYAGLRELTDITYKVIGGDTYVAEALSLNSLITAEDLNKYQCVYVSFENVTIVGKGDNNAPFLYGWDGSGSQGGDIYFDGMVGETKVTFVIESYLTGSNTDVYKAVEALEVGDVINLSGYVYWYNGIQPHIIAIEDVPAT